MAAAALLIAGTRHVVERKIERESAAAANRAAAEPHTAVADLAELTRELATDPREQARLAEEARDHRARAKEYAEAAGGP